MKLDFSNHTVKHIKSPMMCTMSFGPCFVPVFFSSSFASSGFLFIYSEKLKQNATRIDMAKTRTKIKLETMINDTTLRNRQPRQTFIQLKRKIEKSKNIFNWMNSSRKIIIINRLLGGGERERENKRKKKKYRKKYWQWHWSHQWTLDNWTTNKWTKNIKKNY